MEGRGVPKEKKRGGEVERKEKKRGVRSTEKEQRGKKERKREQQIGRKKNKKLGMLSFPLPAFPVVVMETGQNLLLLLDCFFFFPWKKKTHPVPQVH